MSTGVVTSASQAFDAVATQLETDLAQLAGDLKAFRKAFTEYVASVEAGAPTPLQNLVNALPKIRVPHLIQVQDQSASPAPAAPAAAGGSQ